MKKRPHPENDESEEPNQKKLKRAMPINYDFGKNWKTQVVQHLDRPLVELVLKSSMQLYLEKTGAQDPTDCFPPCKHMLNKGNWEKLQTKRIDVLRKENKLDADIVELEKQEQTPEIRSKLQSRYAEVLKKPWSEAKLHLASYFAYGSCHIYNGNFGLLLASCVQPQEKWKVRTSQLHTTIINEENTKIFDILYYGLCGRHEEQEFGTIIADNERDSTLGGALAFKLSEEISDDTFMLVYFSKPFATQAERAKQINVYEEVVAHIDEYYKDSLSHLPKEVPQYIQHKIETMFNIKFSCFQM